MSRDYMKKYDDFINLLYLPTFFPLLNAIETFFSILNPKVRKRGFTNAAELVKAINQCMYEITTLHFSGYELNKIQSIVKWIKGELII